MHKYKSQLPLRFLILNSCSKAKVKKKLKCTLVQALRLCTFHTAHSGSRGIALLFLDHDTRRGWGVSVTPRPLFTPGKDPVQILQEAGWAPGPVWTGAKNLAPTGIRSPDRPARSQSLYQLRYRGPLFQIWSLGFLSHKDYWKPRIQIIHISYFYTVWRL